MTITTELLLARHGEAHCNRTGRIGGHNTCTGLTDQGRNQVGLLSQYLLDVYTNPPISVLYSSPRRRTHDTADLLGEALGIAPRIDHNLRGLDHGAADGQPWGKVKTHFGGRPQRYPGRAMARGAESWNDFLVRSQGALQTILDRHAGQRILVAAHGETIEASFAYFYRLPLSADEHSGQITSHGGLTHWQQHRNRFGHEVWMLARHNETGHLHTCPKEH